jgi:hypothetical protein
VTKRPERRDTCTWVCGAIATGRRFFLPGFLRANNIPCKSFITLFLFASQLWIYIPSLIFKMELHSAIIEFSIITDYFSRHRLAAARVLPDQSWLRGG